MRLSPRPTHQPQDSWNSLHSSMDMLHRSPSAPCQDILHQNMNAPTFNDTITEGRSGIMLDINCNNILLNHEEYNFDQSRFSLPSSENDNTSRRNSCSHMLSTRNINNHNKNHKTNDNDSDNNNNDNDISKRFPKFFHRSDSNPWTDDSGFSSCSCLYEDKDDSDNGLAINRNRILPIPTLRRSRSYSLDSTSSDFSDCTDSCPKLSSSLPPCYTYSPQHKQDHVVFQLTNRTQVTSPLTHQSIGLSSTAVSEGTKCESQTRKHRKSELPKHLDNQSLSSSNEKRKSVKFRRSKSRHRLAHRTGNDVNNNQPSVTSNKGLHSLAPHRLFGVFQANGLVALVGCVCYTLGLVFLLGLLSIIWSMLSQFVNSSDLKELRLRDNVVDKHRRRDPMTRSMRESVHTVVDEQHIR